MRGERRGISSMTGLARAEGEADGVPWAWELKSVNSRSLDLRLRLPPGFDPLEAQLRARPARSCASSGSKPGGRRKRRSSERLLTLFNSQAQGTPSASPSARAKPVMLEMPRLSPLIPSHGYVRG